MGGRLTKNVTTAAVAAASGAHAESARRARERERERERERKKKKPSKLACWIINFEYPQMWVWPQVPLGGPPPSTPLRPWDPSPPPAWAAPSRSLAKRAKGGGGKREGEGGEGRGLA